MENLIESCDFHGWATKNGVRCTDGRTIMKDAFKHNDGTVVPIVWNHQHNSVDEVLGHALLQNREEGVYTYGKFNDTESGRTAKLLVQHGDINALSIYANGLKEHMSNVMHGNIREVSLVLAGANPEASIQYVIKHGDESDEEAQIFTGEEFYIQHSDENGNKKVDSKDGDETVDEIFNTLTPKQKTVVYAIVGAALEDKENEKDDEETKGGDNTMKHNVFDQSTQENENVLSHSDMEQILADGKRYGSLKESFLAHAGDTEYAEKTQTYGINGTDYLFPEARNLNVPPEFIKRDTGWVAKVMSSVHKSPFSRIKSMFADITEDDARAKGYIKGKLKKEEVFSLLKRTTTPTTIYKKQKMDRDDVIDITDFDVVAWIKSEMRMMLEEEIARAILIGDGRSTASDDKINELNIRPIWKDEDLYTVKTAVTVAADAKDDVKARTFIKSVIKARKNYKGSGEPTMYTTEDMLTDCLLIEDSNGRIIYDSIEKLKSILRVKDIVTVPVMEGLTRTDDEGNNLELGAIIVNLKDYNVGADKGGAVSMFDDFDIDYNAMKYLMETRCSGALIKPYSAMAIEFKTTTSAAG